MTRSLASLAVLATLALLLGAPVSVRAKDLCLVDTLGNHFIFQKVKKFKLNRAVPLGGIYIAGGEVFPMQGMAVLRSNDSVEAAVFVHEMSRGAFVGNNFTASMQTGTDLAGTGAIDKDGDFLHDSGSPLYGWAFEECSTVVIP
jgi:hypothetical protein